MEGGATVPPKDTQPTSCSRVFSGLDLKHEQLTDALHLGCGQPGGPRTAPSHGGKSLMQGISGNSK